MKLQKRNGEQVTFDRRKIEIALEKANTSVAPVDAITSEEIKSIALDVENQCTSIGHIPHVEEVQDLVEKRSHRQEQGKSRPQLHHLSLRASAPSQGEQYGRQDSVSSGSQERGG